MVPVLFSINLLKFKTIWPRPNLIFILFGMEVRISNILSLGLMGLYMGEICWSSISSPSPWFFKGLSHWQVVQNSYVNVLRWHRYNFSLIFYVGWVAVTCPNLLRIKIVKRYLRQHQYISFSFVIEYSCSRDRSHWQILTLPMLLRWNLLLE